MKTTIDLPPSLVSEAKIAARLRGWTVRVLFEESLRAFLQAENRAPSEPFRLEHRIVGGVTPNDMTFAEMLETSGINRR